jgi:hypothetical protein
MPVTPSYWQIYSRTALDKIDKGIAFLGEFQRTVRTRRRAEGARCRTLFYIRNGVFELSARCPFASDLSNQTTLVNCKVPRQANEWVAAPGFGEG